MYYFYREGHLKTTSIEYTTDSKDKFIHITNYSLQKYNNNFNKYEEGNELSFKDFQVKIFTIIYFFFILSKIYLIKGISR